MIINFCWYNYTVNFGSLNGGPLPARSSKHLNKDHIVQEKEIYMMAKTI